MQASKEKAVAEGMELFIQNGNGVNMEEQTKQKLTEMNIDIASALDRFLNNEGLYLGFVRKFSGDENYQKFVHAMEKKQYDDAFTAAHTFKGLCGNLSITGMYEVISREVEFLRAKKYTEAEEMLSEVTNEYNRIVKILDTL